jgi:iron complex outermembrane receptor protein
VRSITGYREYDENTFNDFDATGYIMYDTANVLRQKQFSQELQLAGDFASDRIQYLLGAYYFNEYIFNRIELCTGTDQPRLVNRCLRSINNVGLDVESVALFGQVGWDITDRLNVFAGLRWTRETKEQSFDSQLNNLDRVVTALPPIAIPPPGTVRQALPFTVVEDTFSATTPRVGFDFEFIDDIHLYASYSEGFKSGGFTGRPSNAAIQPFDPERVKSYESGLKTLLFDRALRLNASVFQSDYQDIQLLVFTPISGLFETRNAGDARIRGFEIEADARLGRQLRVGASVGHLDAEYTRLSPQVAGITLNTPLPLTPEWTYSASGAYRQPLGERIGEVRLRADYNYRGTVSYQLEADPLEVQDGYGLLNLRATYVLPNDRIQLSLFGTNVTDEYYLTNAQDTLAGNGTAFGGVGRPREWGLELSLRF